MRRSNKYPGMYPKPGILSYLREQNHVTQAELAAYLSKAIDEKYDYKVRSQLISLWETGKRPVPERYYEPLMDYYGVSLEYLCGMTDNPLGFESDKKNTSFSTSHENEPIKINDLHNYNGLPVFVVFKDYEHKAQWGILDETNMRIVFASFTLSLVRLSTPKVKIYPAKPAFIGTSAPKSKSLALANARQHEQVYIKMTTSDTEVHALYDGWYKKNETDTGFINSSGLVLPYSGYGLSYVAYS